jgi:hypothetical protein
LKARSDTDFAFRPGRELINGQVNVLGTQVEEVLE